METGSGFRAYRCSSGRGGVNARVVSVHGWVGDHWCSGGSGEANLGTMAVWYMRGSYKDYSSS